MKKGRASTRVALGALLAGVVGQLAWATPAYAEGSSGSGMAINADSLYSLSNTVTIVALVVAAICAVLAIARLVMSLKNGSKKKVGLVPTVVLGVAAVAVAAVAGVATYVATNVYPNSIDALFTKSSSADTSVTSSEEEWVQLASDIAEEGMVLLKNDGDTLPLAEGTSVALLGSAAYNPVYSGSGSGQTSSTGAVTIIESLESAGFDVNTAPLDEGVYAIEEAEDSVGFLGATFTIEEASVSDFTGSASFESMAATSDVAIVVIGRTGGEGSDLTKFESADGDDKHYLELSDAEEALLSQARESFDTVVVVYNGANALEMGFVDEYNVDAVIWAGIPGPRGFTALGSILSGAINPSGKLPDTYAYDAYSAPAMENYGEQQAAGTEDYYVDYVENIYVGYKWYETAYAEGAVVTSAKTGETYDYASDYDSIVQYPFGYGLSYTTFEQAITSVSSDSLDPMGELTVTVEVTNTGDVAGRDVVQLYLTSPYTDYDRENGVEKAAVQLLDFGKTGLLEPGESQTIELTFDVEEMAAYDSSHANSDGTTGCYMLDAGDYVLSIRSDAHNEIASETVSLSSQFFYEGNNKRNSDEEVATNKLDFMARGTYLSRADGFANYDEAMASVVDTVDTTYTDDVYAYDASYDEGIDELVEGVDYAAEGDLTLADLKGVSYDDEQWDALISQMDVDDLTSLIECMYNTAEIKSIDKANTKSTDGPIGISSMFSTGGDNVSYPCIPLLAASFNKELAYTYGSYFADQAHSEGISTWYAPAMNIHRTAFSGRNFEYYSEDAVLSGKMASSEVSGAREKGLVATVKHFALNDQESQRSGRLHTYSNEQAAREIYLRPFEDAIKDGNATAVMNSMNYVGDKWIGVSSEIQQGILRGEWGFVGSVLTDMAEGDYCTGSGDAALRAGTDIWLTFNDVNVSTDTSADIYYLQRAAKNILYAEANAETVEAEILDWESMIVRLDIALGVIAAACAVGLVARVIRMKKAAAEPTESTEQK